MLLNRLGTKLRQIAAGAKAPSRRPTWNLLAYRHCERVRRTSVAIRCRLTPIMIVTTLLQIASLRLPTGRQARNDVFIRRFLAMTSSERVVPAMTTPNPSKFYKYQPNLFQAESNTSTLTYSPVKHPVIFAVCHQVLRRHR